MYNKIVYLETGYQVPEILPQRNFNTVESHKKREDIRKFLFRLIPAELSFVTWTSVQFRALFKITLYLIGIIVVT